jgi:DNA-binding MarR family transcriptional regulator
MRVGPETHSAAPHRFIKEKDALDRRKINLRLSEAGLGLIQLLIPMSRKATMTTLKPLSIAQRAQLYKLLGLVLEEAD